MTRVGLGFDVHPFDPATPLILGGQHLDGPGLSGHSDGDAVAHAVADALLGAAGLGDLGSRFPASDERWRGADSMALLADVAGAVAADGWFVHNVDVVVAAEAPRLSPHAEAMRAAVAGALEPACEPGVARVPVSVKPKRGEGLGFVGRTEGIAVWAVALLGRANAGGGAHGRR